MARTVITDRSRGTRDLLDRGFCPAGADDGSNTRENGAPSAPDFVRPQCSLDDYACRYLHPFPASRLVVPCGPAGRYARTDRVGPVHLHVRVRERAFRTWL